MIIYSIYKLTNKINNKIYVGFTKSKPEYRWNQHKKDARNNSGYQIHEAIRKYGWDNFDCEVIYQSTNINHCLNEMEPYFIEFYDTYANGYNATKGGGGKVSEASQETKQKMSKAKIGTKRSAKSIEKGSDTTKKLWEENYEYMYSVCSRKGEQNGMFGLTGEKSPHYGKKHTKDRCKNISNALKGKKKSQEHIENMSKSYIITHPDGNQQIIKNLTKFCRENKLTTQLMRMVVYGKQTHHKGYKVTLCE